MSCFSFSLAQSLACPRPSGIDYKFPFSSIFNSLQQFDVLRLGKVTVMDRTGLNVI